MINSAIIPKAYSEVYCFINALGEEYKNKIPNKIYDMIEKNRDMEYNIILTKDQQLKNGMLSHEALSLIAALNLKYWCINSEEKEELKKIYILNNEKEQEKYSYENLFKNNEKNNNINEVVESNEVMMIEYKEGFFKKIFSIIKKLFKKSIK